MQWIEGFQKIFKKFQSPVVTIGNFDGVHLGHLQIMRETIAQARALEGTSVVMTFRPHPQVALSPGKHLPLLATYDERAELIKSAGIDVLIEEPFSRQFSTLSSQDFFRDVLLKHVGARAIVVGYDFAFGKGREGHLEKMRELCTESGIRLTVVPPWVAHQEIVSSSRIRAHYLQGELEIGNRLLGREFFYRGVVVRGDGRGKKLGFATANLKLEDKLALPNGVYATRAVIEGHETVYRSVTNIGVRPTFQANEADASLLPALIETHLLDHEIDLYGRTVEVRFVGRLRDERRFNGVDELKAQIERDCESAREKLAPPKS